MEDQVYRKRSLEGHGPCQGQIVVMMIHSGSRGLGHQVCSDYTRRMVEAMGRYGCIKLPDSSWQGAPSTAPRPPVFRRMVAATNYAWANEGKSSPIRSGRALAK